MKAKDEKYKGWSRQMVRVDGAKELWIKYTHPSGKCFICEPVCEEDKTALANYNNAQNLFFLDEWQ